jgi:hypothetical protein
VWFGIGELAPCFDAFGDDLIGGLAAEDALAAGVIETALFVLNSVNRMNRPKAAIADEFTRLCAAKSPYDGDVGTAIISPDSRQRGPSQ